MPNVTLHGETGQRTLPVQPKPVPTVPSAGDNMDPDGKHRKTVFARLRDLKPRFDAAGITFDDYWNCIKSDLEITSRSELTVPMWARLGATLCACQRDRAMFDNLVAKIKRYRDAAKADATPIVFAEPDYLEFQTCFVMRLSRKDSTKKLVFIGEMSEKTRERCQQHADQTRCIVRLYHNGQPPEAFYPSRSGAAPF